MERTNSSKGIVRLKERLKNIRYFGELPSQHSTLGILSSWALNIASLSHFPRSSTSSVSSSMRCDQDSGYGLCGAGIDGAARMVKYDSTVQEAIRDNAKHIRFCHYPRMTFIKAFLYEQISLSVKNKDSIIFARATTRPQPLQPLDLRFIDLLRYKFCIHLDALDECPETERRFSMLQRSWGRDENETISIWMFSISMLKNGKENFGIFFENI